MEARAGRDVELEVRVVHAVETSQHRHRMEHYVLQVDREVEDRDRNDDRQPAGHVEGIKQSPAALLGDDRQRDGEEGEGERQDQGILAAISAIPQA